MPNTCQISPKQIPLETKLKRAMKGKREHRKHLFDSLPGCLSFPGHGNQCFPSWLGIFAILTSEAAPTLSPENDLNACPIMMHFLNKLQ